MSDRAGARGKPLAAIGRAIHCSKSVSFPVRARGLVTAQPYDYVAIRLRHGRGAAPSTDAWDLPIEQVTVVSQAGKACKSAHDRRCAEKVAHHPSAFVEQACGFGCSEHSVVTTRGDEVQRWATPEELRALLGVVDSFDDALLLVAAAGYQITCNDAVRTSVAEADGGYLVTGTRITADCAPVITTRYVLHVSRQGDIEVREAAELTREEHACIGRKPEGLHTVRSERVGSTLGAFLARCAHLESASVLAFARMADELAAHGAPEELVERAREARDDEVRHAESVAALARARGGRVEPAQVDAMSVRSLEEIALENAVEGCVRETYGALVGAHQAERAGDLELRHAMVSIAADEARHASLSHAVHAWILPRLSVAARARVERAQERALHELVAHETAPSDPRLAYVAGLPSAGMASRLLEELTAALWFPAAHA